jgi:cytochrome c551/c552
LRFIENRFSLRGTLRIVVLAAGLGAALNGNSTAQAAQVPVVAVSQVPARIQGPVAAGLYVPGAGANVSRAGAIASIERGEVENAVLGGKPDGERRIRVTFTPPPDPRGRIIYIGLPPPGTHRNDRRYPILVVGLGKGLLASSSTRIAGLVAVTDIADEAEALAEGRAGPLHVRHGDVPDLVRLDRRLGRAHAVRSGGLGIAAGLLAALGAVAFLLRARLLARASVLLGAALVTASLITSGAGVERATPVLLALAGITLGLAIAGSLLPRAPLVAAALLALLLVLALNTAVNSFGPLGPHPEGGGRFYGLSNLQETLLLPPVLAAASGASLVPIGILALVTVGWSHAGADGGGMLVLAVALAVLWFRQRQLALTFRRLALIAAGAVLVGLALVGLDAALGGSSHVTHAVGSGSVFDDVWHRWHLSWAVVTSSWHKGLFFLAALAGLVWLATRPRHGATVDAMIVAVVVSLAVNDTPVDVAGIGALGGLALLAWERTRPSVDSRPMRRSLLALPLIALAVAGCGGEGTTRAAPETVVGTVQQEAPGKAIFMAQGCNGCHTYQPANATATVGPDLDKLADYAKKAKQPLDAFVHESIVKPSAYIEKGYPDAMPKSYASLPKSDLDALVEFLTKPQG